VLRPSIPPDLTDLDTSLVPDAFAKGLSPQRISIAPDADVAESSGAPIKYRKRLSPPPRPTISSDLQEAESSVFPVCNVVQ